MLKDGFFTLMQVKKLAGIQTYVFILQIIEYRGGRTLSDLEKFVKSGGTDHGVDGEEAVDDEMLDSLEDNDEDFTEGLDDSMGTEEVPGMCFLKPPLTILINLKQV